MKLLSYDYDLMKKYIICSDDSKTIHYVYKIMFNPGTTELIKYEFGIIKNTIEIKSVILFNTKQPIKSVENFYKILLLGG